MPGIFLALPLFTAGHVMKETRKGSSRRVRLVSSLKTGTSGEKMAVSV